MIDSSASAEKNSLSTGQLITQDIANHSEFSSSTFGLSLSYSSNPKETGNLGHGFNAMPDIPQFESRDDRSTTRSALAAGSVQLSQGDQKENEQQLASLNRDVQAERNKRVLDPLPDLQRTLKNQADTAKAVRAVDPARLASEWGSFANAEYEEARQRGDTQGMSCWSAEGACRAAGHGVMGGLLGGSGAAIGAGLSSLAGPSLAQAGAQAGLDPEVVAQLGATGLGALVGGGAGAVAANNEIRNNYLGLIRLIQLGGEAVARGGAGWCGVVRRPGRR